MLPLQKIISYDNNNAIGHFIVNLDLYNPEEGSSQFSHLLSRALQTYKTKGVLAFYSIDAEAARLLTLSAWHAGWKVLLIPENSSTDKILAIVENVDILVCNSSEQSENLNTSACLILPLESSNESTNSLLSWLNQQKKLKNNLTYLWSEHENAVIFYTSGSTGEPKGICHSLSSMVCSANRFIKHFQISKNDKVLNTAPLHTMSGFRGSVMLPFVLNCTVNTLNDEATVSNIIQSLGQYQSTIMITGPNIVCQLSLLSEKLSILTSHLRVILSTGAKLDRNSRVKIFKNLNIPVVDYYGLTETGGLVIAESIEDFKPNCQSIGKACADVKLELINPNNSKKYQGEGELRIYSNSIFLGYLGEELGHKTFFDTGDQASISDTGDVSWLYRLKSGIKGISTEWIYTEIVDAWVRKQNQVEDVHIKVHYDKYSRAGFKVKIAGVPLIDWDSWCFSTYKQLLEQLGNEYNIICWVRVESIIRTNLGKYDYCIYKE